ncbi:MAG: hypothetical protein AB1546_15480 [bacterium]
MKFKVENVFARCCVVVLLFSFTMLPRVVRGGEALIPDPKMIIDNRCVDDLARAGVKKLLKPHILGDAFVGEWKIKDYKYAEAEIIFFLYNKNIDNTIQVFLRQKDKKSPAYEKTRLFDILYRKEKNTRFAEEEDKALKAFVDIIHRNEGKKTEIFKNLKRAYKECRVVNGKVIQSTIPKGQPKTGAPQGKTGQGTTSAKENQTTNLLGSRIFGIPIYIPLIFAVLILLYLLTWWFEKRGAKGSS